MDARGIYLMTEIEILDDGPVTKCVRGVIGIPADEVLTETHAGESAP